MTVTGLNTAAVRAVLERLTRAGAVEVRGTRVRLLRPLTIDELALNDFDWPGKPRRRGPGDCAVCPVALLSGQCKWPVTLAGSSWASLLDATVTGPPREQRVAITVPGTIGGAVAALNGIRR